MAFDFVPVIPCFVIVLIAVSCFYYYNLTSLAGLWTAPVKDIKFVGDDLCPDLESGSVSINRWDAVMATLLLGFTTTPKGIFNGEPVVLKRLADPDELADFEVAFNKETPRGQTPNILRLFSLVRQAIHDPLVRSTRVLKLQLCPARNDITGFIRRVVPDVYNSTAVMPAWTTLSLNPEPFVLLLLRPPLWPVPKYYGSCGVTGIFEDCGTMLTSFIDRPWLLRAKAALQLLKMAHNFLYLHPDYMFYLTDISPDNFAVDRNGTVRVIDLENIVVVDKKELKKEKNVGKHHASENFECQDCFAYSVGALCSHTVSDHNIYGICREIFYPSVLFPNGFLHSPPKKITSINWGLDELIKGCVMGSKNRFKIADQIKQQLEFSLEILLE